MAGQTEAGGGRTRPRRAIVAAVVAVVVAVGWGALSDIPRNWWAAMTGQRPLLAARSWHYQLDAIDVDRLARLPSDLLVTDFAREGGRVPLQPDEVARLKRRPGGGRRLVVAYMSIGEAEDFRGYWQPQWKDRPEPWDVAENCAWPHAHMVRFWLDGWKDLVMRAPGAYLRRIIDAGFDGVYLDRVDVYEHQTEPGRDLRGDMIGFVIELSRLAKGLKPGFLVIPQNAEDLLTDRAYRRAIDGLGKEDLLFGVAATGRRNKAREVGASLALLRRLRWDWKPVFVVEYLETAAAIAKAGGELRELGFVPTFQHRSLDGSDPMLPAAPKEEVHGTPEWIAKECRNRRWW